MLRRISFVGDSKFCRDVSPETFVGVINLNGVGCRLEGLGQFGVACFFAPRACAILWVYHSFRDKT